jgi:hypothetical protein
MRVSITVDKKLLQQLSKSDTIKLMLPISTLHTYHMIPNKNDFSHLTGTLHLRDAEKKYSVSVVTLSRWVKRGYMRSAGRDGNRVLIYESDVAYLAAVHNSLGGQGKSIIKNLK